MFRKNFLFFIITFASFLIKSNAVELTNQNTQLDQKKDKYIEAIDVNVVNEESINNIENKEPEPKNVLYIELKDGIVIAELFPKKAPLHVQRITSLTKDGFYDKLKFHRVISGFMAQTGDPTDTGRGGSRYGKVHSEFNDEHHTRGTLSMARASDPNSANSQFFIVTGKFFPELDGQYSVFGRVIEGMEYVDKIKNGDVSKNGIVENPDIMIKVVTGDMLNDKSISKIKKEIEIIQKMQEEKKKEDPNFQNKSILEILLETKDIDIENDMKEDSKQESNNTLEENKEILDKNIDLAPTENINKK